MCLANHNHRNSAMSKRTLDDEKDDESFSKRVCKKNERKDSIFLSGFELLLCHQPIFNTIVQYFADIQDEEEWIMVVPTILWETLLALVRTSKLIHSLAKDVAFKFVAYESWSVAPRPRIHYPLLTGVTTLAKLLFCEWHLTRHVFPPILLQDYDLVEKVIEHHVFRKRLPLPLTSLIKEFYDSSMGVETFKNIFLCFRRFYPLRLEQHLNDYTTEDWLYLFGRYREEEPSVELLRLLLTDANGSFVPPRLQAMYTIFFVWNSNYKYHWRFPSTSHLVEYLSPADSLKDSPLTHL
jgi:hypothetical protein